DLDDPESGRVQQLTELVQGVSPNRDLLLELATVVEDHRAVRQDSRGEGVELDLFEDHAAIALPPHPRWQVPDDVVAVEDLDHQPSAGLEGPGDVLCGALVGLVVEISEGREQAVGAVELRVEGGLAHVAVDEV